MSEELRYTQNKELFDRIEVDHTHPLFARLFVATGVTKHVTSQHVFMKVPATGGTCDEYVVSVTAALTKPALKGHTTWRPNPNQDGTYRMRPHVVAVGVEKTTYMLVPVIGGEEMYQPVKERTVVRCRFDSDKRENVLAEWNKYASQFPVEQGERNKFLAEIVPKLIAIESLCEFPEESAAVGVSEEEDTATAGAPGKSAIDALVDGPEEEGEEEEEDAAMVEMPPKRAGAVSVATSTSAADVAPPTVLYTRDTEERLVTEAAAQEKADAAAARRYAKAAEKKRVKAAEEIDEAVPTEVIDIVDAEDITVSEPTAAPLEAEDVEMDDAEAEEEVEEEEVEEEEVEEAEVEEAEVEEAEVEEAEAEEVEAEEAEAEEAIDAHMEDAHADELDAEPAVPEDVVMDESAATAPSTAEQADPSEGELYPLECTMDSKDLEMHKATPDAPETRVPKRSAGSKRKASEALRQSSAAVKVSKTAEDGVITTKQAKQKKSKAPRTKQPVSEASAPKRKKMTPEQRAAEKQRKIDEKAAEKQRKIDEKAAEKQRKIDEKAAEKQRKIDEKAAKKKQAIADREAAKKQKASARELAKAEKKALAEKKKAASKVAEVDAGVNMAVASAVEGLDDGVLKKTASKPERKKSATAKAKVVVESGAEELAVEAEAPNGVEDEEHPDSEEDYVSDDMEEVVESEDDFEDGAGDVAAAISETDLLKELANMGPDYSEGLSAKNRNEYRRVRMAIERIRAAASKQISGLVADANDQAEALGTALTTSYGGSIVVRVGPEAVASTEEAASPARLAMREGLENTADTFMTRLNAIKAPVNVSAKKLGISSAAFTAAVDAFRDIFVGDKTIAAMCAGGGMNVVQVEEDLCSKTSSTTLVKASFARAAVAHRIIATDKTIKMAARKQSAKRQRDRAMLRAPPA